MTDEMNQSRSETGEDWYRPWIYAAVLGLAGLAFGLLIDGAISGELPVGRQVAATFVFVAGVAWVLVFERLRGIWALGFALGAAAVVASIGYFSASYSPENGTVFGWTFAAAIFATLIAAPLFQTARDEGAWRFSYRTLHVHAWTDAVIGAASLAFVGLSFLVTVLIAQLLGLIEIDFLKDALEEEVFGWGLAGAAFGAAAGILRDRDKLLGTMLTVVLTILSVLAPFFAAGLALFLLALPFTGLEPLWATDQATPILLVCAAGAVVFVNAIIGNARADYSRVRLLRICAVVLGVTVLPLAVIAAWSMGIRIEQHGWTPARLWAAVTVFLAVTYGAAYLWSVVKGRLEFDEPLRPLNTRLAIGTCALALVLATPLVDFGAISTDSQLARLESGEVAPQEFDFWALKEDFGPAGRAALERMQSGSGAIATVARVSLSRETRWEARRRIEAIEASGEVGARLRMADGGAVPAGLAEAVAYRSVCGQGPCVAVSLGGARYAVIGQRYRGEQLVSEEIDLAEGARTHPMRIIVEDDKPTENKLTPGSRVELRAVEMRQVYVDGEPVGDPIPPAGE